MPTLTPIQDIQPFIDLDCYTIPLRGTKLYRDKEGKKQGILFTSWSKWKDIKNETPTALGGLVTGIKSSIVAIDCDCKASWELFRSLDPTNTAYFESVGKLDDNGNLIECGTILYRYTDDLPDTTAIKGDYDLDWFNGNKFIYLPTASNETKTAWKEGEDYHLYNHKDELIDIKRMPSYVKKLLNVITHQAKPIVHKSVADTTPLAYKGYLGKYLGDIDFKELLSSGEYIPLVTRLLTPKEYRNDKYNKQSHLHPNDVEARHDYQFKIMCQLAGDSTVSEILARRIMYYLNSLWDRPRPTKQLETEVISKIVSGEQTNAQGQPYWVYNEDWENDNSFQILTKKPKSHILDIFYDQHRKDYFIYNTDENKVDSITKKTDLFNHLRAISATGFNQNEAIDDMLLVETVVKPTEDFGYLGDMNDMFNLFKPTEELRILADPKRHIDDYREPIEFIAFMKHFVPDAQQRKYLLSLIRTKLTTFSYSPVVPYIIGIPGSGKNVLVNILAKMIGEKYVSKEVDGQSFINQFNKGILENKYIVNLNELSDSLKSFKEKREAMGKLKLYTGATTFQCQGKGDNFYEAPMTAMFIMTANANPLDVDDNDRRIYYIKTPNTLDSNPICAEGTDPIVKAMYTGTKDIAYYLSTEIDNLRGNDYTTAPKHSGRMEIIFQSKGIADKLSWALKHKQFKLLEDYVYNPDMLFRESAKGRVYLSDLEDIYSEAGGKSDNPTTLLKMAMKEQGFKVRQGTDNVIYYSISGIKEYEHITYIEEDINAEDIRV